MRSETSVLVPSRTQLRRGNSSFGSGGRPDGSALQMYHQARNRSWTQELWTLLRGRASSLLDLDEVRRNCNVRGSHYAGLCRVPLHQIRGSEGRCGDFDADFRPLMPHNEGRWLSVAAARQRGLTLPPVDLVQVGDTYFVQDGHHRVSVARARREKTIEAKVTVWEVAGAGINGHKCRLNAALQLGDRIALVPSDLAAS